MPRRLRFCEPVRRRSGWSYQRKPFCGYVVVLPPFSAQPTTTFLTVRAALAYIRRAESAPLLEPAQ